MNTLKYALQVGAVWAVWLTALAIGVSPWLLALRLAGITGIAVMGGIYAIVFLAIATVLAVKGQTL
jgi:hypothetical protein